MYHPFYSSRADSLLPCSVRHVRLREQDDSAGDALQPQGQKGGPVASTGEKEAVLSLSLSLSGRRRFVGVGVRIT